MMIDIGLIFHQHLPRRPTNLDDGRARAYCACRMCGWGLFVGWLVVLGLTAL